MQKSIRHHAMRKLAIRSERSARYCLEYLKSKARVVRDFDSVEKNQLGRNHAKEHTTSCHEEVSDRYCQSTGTADDRKFKFRSDSERFSVAAASRLPFPGQSRPHLRAV